MDASAPAPSSAPESMTGFASAQGEVEGWSWTLDLRSVNGRGLDLRLRLPDWIPGLEPDIRKRLQAAVSRGNVTMNLRVQRDGGGAEGRLSEAGLATALSVLQRIEVATGQAGMKLRKTSAAEIASLRGVMEGSEAAPEASDALKAAILDDTDAAIAAFVEDRRREGAALMSIVTGQLARIESLIEEARTAAGDRADAAKDAMARALARLLEADTDIPDEGRLAQELALIAVKTDISEEIDRLEAHVTAARQLLATPGPIGRKLDFLIQEFNREANTLCSKSQSTELTAAGLELKTVIDQMREQVQNIQ